TDAGLEKLRERKLVSVDLRYTRVTRSGADGLRAALPNCYIIFLDSAARPAPAGRVISPSPGKDDKSIADWVRRVGGAAEMQGGRIIKISLSAAPVTDSQIQGLAALSGLRSLDLEGTETGNLALRAVGKIPRLEELNLSHTSG